MAAVTGNIEWMDRDTARGESDGVYGGSLGTLGATKSRPPKREAAPLAKSHAQLSRLLWIRRTVELYLAGKGRDRRERRIALVQDQSGELRFEITPEIPNNAIPWAYAGSSIPSIGLWGKANDKMLAPTFDLPAGPEDQGGSCPGSSFGQTTSTLVEASLRAKPPKPLIIPESPGGAEPAKPLNVREAICESCYATGGSYAYLIQQVGEVVRLWWLKGLERRGEAGRQEFLRIMLRGLTALEFNATTWSHDGQRVPLADGIWPVRVHASGDFFHPTYASWWMDLANAAAGVLPKVHFWAPTRTWVTWGPNAWPRILARLKQNNFSVRASGFHVGENAPGRLAPAGTFGASMGSTSIYQPDMRPDDTRYDFNCGVFKKDSSGAKARSCDRALGPDGQVGCRACWVQGQLRINYQNH